MQRVFLKDTGRILKGEIRDYPVSTWKDFFPGYDKFTRPVEEAAAETAMKPRRAEGQIA